MAQSPGEPIVSTLTKFRTMWCTSRESAATTFAVKIAGRHATPSPVFDTYCRFAAERQAIYEARLAGAPGPWADNPILECYKFTNGEITADSGMAGWPARTSPFATPTRNSRYLPATSDSCSLRRADRCAGRARRVH